MKTLVLGEILSGNNHFAEPFERNPEQPVTLARTPRHVSNLDRLIIIDCLTLWIRNFLMFNNEARIQQEKADFLNSVSVATGELVMVANETSMGVIPVRENGIG